MWMSSKLCPQSAPSQLGGVAFRSCPSSSSAMSFYVEAASSTTRLLWPIDSGVVPSGCGGRRGVASERRLPASYRDSAPPYIFDILIYHERRDTIARSREIADLSRADSNFNPFHKFSQVADLEALIEMMQKCGRSEKAAVWIQQPEFGSLVRKLKDAAKSNYDPRAVVAIVDAASHIRYRTPELDDLVAHCAQQFGKRPSGTYSPKLLSIAALAFSGRGFIDRDFIKYIRSEALDQVYDMDPPHAIALLEAFRRWGADDKQLIDLLCEKLTDDVNRMASRDVVECLQVIAQMGAAKGYLISQVATAAFQNLHVFTPVQISHLAESLGRLRFLVKENIWDLLDQVKHSEERLNAPCASRFLMAMALMLPEFDDHRAVLSYVKQFCKQQRSESLHLVHLLDAAWAIVRYKHVLDEPSLVPSLAPLFRRLSAEAPPSNRGLLKKAADIFLSLQLEEWTHLPQAVGMLSNAEKNEERQKRAEGQRDAAEKARKIDNDLAKWRAASIPIVARNKRKFMSRVEIRAKLLSCFSQARWLRFKFDLDAGLLDVFMLEGELFSMEMNHERHYFYFPKQDVTAGPYRVDMRYGRLVVDVDGPESPTTCAVKHRILEKLGFRPISINYWRWRQCKSDEDEIALLEDAVGPVLLQMTPDDFNFKWQAGR